MTARRPARSAVARMLAALGAACAITVVVSACGVPDSSNFEEIRPEDVPFGLNDIVTTTTTTTTLPTTSTSLDTIPPDGSPIGETTTTVVDTEQVELYFVTSTIEPRLTSLTRAMSRPAGLSQVIAALVEGPPVDIGTGLKSLVPDGLVSGVEEKFGVAVVELDDEVFSDVPNSDQDALIAQLVLTLGNRPGVGQVRFVKDGENMLVRVPSRNYILSAQPVAADDFASLLSDAANPPPTTTEASPPTSVVPPPDTADTTTTRPPRRTTTTTTTTDQ